MLHVSMLLSKLNTSHQPAMGTGYMIKRELIHSHLNLNHQAKNVTSETLSQGRRRDAPETVYTHTHTQNPTMPASDIRQLAFDGAGEGGTRAQSLRIFWQCPVMRCVWFLF